MRILCWLLVCALSLSALAENATFPESHSASNRILGMILTFDFSHIDPLMMIFNEYVSMCEGGWDPTVVIFTTIQWSEPVRRLIRYKTFCYRTNRFIDIRYSIHDASIGIGLGSLHRALVGEELNNFDVFAYHEDDIVFKYSHLVAYLQETKKLYSLLADSAYRDYCIGFQRYRRLLRYGDLHHSEFKTQDLIEQELLEETPNFVPICLKEQPYLRVDGNIHQAIWVLTRGQILVLQDKCQFLNQSSASREYMSSFSLFDKKRYHCGLQKILPPTLQTMSILHYYQQRHVSWIPVFSVDDNLRAGFQYGSADQAPQELVVPECWKPLVDANRLDRAIVHNSTLHRRHRT